MKHFYILLLLACSVQVFAEALPAPEGAEVYFISPKNGDVVSGSFKVVMGLSGMGVAPAGTQNDKTGHHHLIIDAKTPESGIPIGKDEHHRHFGGGQTETSIELAPGEHSLQLVLGDFAHRPHSPAVASEVITITVK